MKFGFERTVVSKFKSKRRVGSGNEPVDYSRAPCLGTDQKARGLWERDWIGPAWQTCVTPFDWNARSAIGHYKMQTADRVQNAD